MRQRVDAFLNVLATSVVALAVAGCGTSNDAATSPAVVEPAEVVALTATTLAGTAGTPVDPVPTVQVRDKSGRPLPGVAVTFEVTAGQGSLTGASTRTGPDGAARPGSWTLGTVAAKPNVLRARLSGDAGTWIEFKAVATAGDAHIVMPTRGNAQTGYLGSALPEPLSVKVMDVFGNAIGGAVVTFAPMADNGSIDAPSATSNAAGVATSGIWTLGTIAGQQRAKATAGTADFLLTASAVARCATDCPTSQRLVYVSNGDIYTVNTDGSELMRLTSTGTNSEPTWSPDGRRIAFVENTINGAHSIRVMDADGGNVRLFASAAMSPAWSPDARMLAYSGFALGESSIVIAPVDGLASPRRVGFTRGANQWPAWSPDGSKLAFISDYSAFDFAYEVYVMNADGSNITQLTNGFGNSKTWPTYTMYGQPVWSPDGRQIALVSCPAWQYGNCDESSVAVMSADGSGFRELVAAGGYARPAWSADGKYLAYAHTCRHSYCSPAIYFIPAAGGSERLLILAGHSAEWRP